MQKSHTYNITFTHPLIVTTQISLTGKKLFFIAYDLNAFFIVHSFYKTSYITKDDIIKFYEHLANTNNAYTFVEVAHFNHDFTVHHAYKNVKTAEEPLTRLQIKNLKRFVDTFKKDIRNLLIQQQTYLPPQKTHNTKTKTFPWAYYDKHLNTVLQKQVQYYNNTINKNCLDLSPYDLYKDLLLHYEKKTKAQKALVVYAPNKPIIQKQTENTLQLKNDYWKTFFFSMKKQLTVQHKELIKENTDLKKIVEKQNVQLNYLTQQEQTKQQLINTRELLKQKRKLAEKLPLRDIITLKEFEKILQHMKTTHQGFAQARRKVALILLYLTGLRVSNLLVLNVKHIKAFLQKQNITITLNKKGAHRHTLGLSDLSSQFLQKFNKDIKIICENKKSQDPLFTNAVDLHHPISRVTFDNELNKILIKASDTLGKHLRTHSFRATLITDLLVETPIDKVRDLIGHKDIKSTLLYKRSKLNTQDLNIIQQNLDETRNKIHKLNTRSSDNL